MAARAYTEYDQPEFRLKPPAVNIHGTCFKQEVLAIGVAAVVSTVGLTEAEWNKKDTVVRICTDDTACFFATGTAPDPTLLAATLASSARRYLGVGQSLTVLLQPGHKVGVIQVT